MNFQNISYQVDEKFTAKLITGEDYIITKGAIITLNFLKNEAGEVTNTIDIDSVNLIENRGRKLSFFKHLDYKSININTLIEVDSFGWKQNMKREYAFTTI